MERSRTEAEIGSVVYRHAVEFAKAQGRNEGELLDELIEESVRMREHPGIGFKGGPAGRRDRQAGPRQGLSTRSRSPHDRA